MSTDTSVGVTPREVWRRNRGIVMVLLFVLVAATALVLLRGGSTGGTLEPESPAPDGGRALARLLADAGVEVVPVRFVADAADALADRPATLLVTTADLAPGAALADLTDAAASSVLVEPGPAVLDDLPGRLTVHGRTEVASIEPRCELPAAVAAGSARMGGLTYDGGDAEARRCYPVDDAGAALVRTGRLTVLGTHTLLTNGELAEDGDAALAMRLLGEYDRLVWYLPSASDPALADEQRPLLDLLPAGWRYGLVQAVLAVLLVALWRARRLGRLVGEDLPVVVRAAETEEGRARLYERAGATDHAAAALREATVRRLLPRLGLPAGTPPDAVVEATATRTGAPHTAVHQLLYGPPPTSDADLVALADDLTTLETEVTTR
jgi:hypothetical protein